jgi:hypothetical protein
MAADVAEPVGHRRAESAFRRSDVGDRRTVARSKRGRHVLRQPCDGSGDNGELRALDRRGDALGGIIHRAALRGDGESTRISVATGHVLDPHPLGGKPDGRADQAGADDREPAKRHVTRRRRRQPGRSGA